MWPELAVVPEPANNYVVLSAVVSITGSDREGGRSGDGHDAIIGETHSVRRNP